MADGRARVDAGEYARRVNAAVELLESGMPVADAARVLAERFGCSVRQARRYAERAASVGRSTIPEATTVFTVKLPAALVARVRQRASESGSTISALVTQALTEFLARGHGKRPRR
ncbi:ribbon-helix-helix protein, CopG family [Kibdelosporangium philippinense]|uniref:Ribbon-helix-helix protein, CopG family n=1 Tax=Kibdelosporangium philippinense TaxID=211113 RepID=A0ABS8Z9P1_9PSEU|nr:ribbon-helix-helix protein, CopG family [Kibdelosporangium philippinense]MCE7004535.1 ribbon-helix-helix protein, CopG family [Kibdelosporangium philippinense]MCE7006413.1 ribbon-helix-helix protein, CopG family [Kibdelosporangium philippinense]